MNSLAQLDEAARRKFYGIMTNEMLHMQNIVQLRRRKLMDDVDYETWLRYSASLIRTPGGAAVWPTLKAILTPTVTEAIDAYLDKYPDQPSYLDLNSLFRIIAPSA